MAKYQNPQIYTVKGEYVWQIEEVIEGVRHSSVRTDRKTDIMINRAIHKKDTNTYWMYRFWKGDSVGTPLRGKSRQRQIKEFINKVESALK